MSKTSNVLQLLYDEVTSKINKSIEEGDCPSVRVFYNNDTDDTKSFNISITEITVTSENEATLKVSNDSNISLSLNDIDLTHMEAISKSTGEEIFTISEHTVQNTYVSYDEIKIKGIVSNMAVGDTLSVYSNASIFLKSDMLNLPCNPYANRSFYKTEMFILTCSIRTRDDVSAFLMEDITDVIKEIFDNYGAIIELSDNLSIMKLDNDVKILDIVENSTILQKRDIKIMLGFNVINTNFLN